MTRNSMLRRLVFALSIYLAAEGFSFAGLQLLRIVRGITYFPMRSTLTPEARGGLDAFLAAGQGARMGMDPVLGWVPKPSAEVNAAGIRDDRDYDPHPAPGMLRVSAFGDSFTYGADVRLGENWAKQVSAMRPTIEVLNYGVGAYGLDQGYLRYLQVGRDYHPHAVFIGYMTENLARNVNVYRGFYGTFYRDTIFSKPRFLVDRGALVLLPNPLASLADYRRFRDNEETVLSQLGRHDYHYARQYPAGPLDFLPSVRLGKMVAAQIRGTRQTPILKADGRYEPQSEAYEVTIRIFDAFYRKVLDDGALPIIVVLPDTNDQARSRAGKSRRYEVLLEYFRSKGYRYIDALGALEPVQQRHTVGDLTVAWGHFSKLGNEIVAHYILDTLAGWDLDSASKVSSAAASERRRFGLEATASVP